MLICPHFSAGAQQIASLLLSYAPSDAQFSIFFSRTGRLLAFSSQRRRTKASLTQTTIWSSILCQTHQHERRARSVQLISASGVSLARR